MRELRAYSELQIKINFNLGISPFGNFIYSLSKNILDCLNFVPGTVMNAGTTVVHVSQRRSWSSHSGLSYPVRR